MDALPSVRHAETYPHGFMPGVKRFGRVDEPGRAPHSFIYAFIHQGCVDACVNPLKALALSRIVRVKIVRFHDNRG